MDAARAPELVGQAHVLDQLTDLQRTLGLPPCRLDFQRQNDRNPARCQRTTVSGRTMASASKMPGARRYNPTNTNRSKVRKTGLFGDLRRSTLICCRRTRISASSRTLERISLVSGVYSSMKISTIGLERHPIRPASQPDRVSDKDKCHSFRTLRLPGVKPETNRVTMPGVALRISASFLRRMAIRTSLAPR